MTRFQDSSYDGDNNIFCVGLQCCVKGWSWEWDRLGRHIDWQHTLFYTWYLNHLSHEIWKCEKILDIVLCYYKILWPTKFYPINSIYKHNSGLSSSKWQFCARSPQPVICKVCLCLAFYPICLSSSRDVRMFINLQWQSFSCVGISPCRHSGLISYYILFYLLDMEWLKWTNCRLTMYYKSHSGV